MRGRHALTCSVSTASLATTRTAIYGALAALALGTSPAAAQGTFQTLDPSYGGETARRAFYDGFAVSGEAAYRDGDLLGVAGPSSFADLSLSARLDYALLPQVDLALVADLSGAAQNGRMGLTWVVVKPYWHSEATDYAVRVAVDPQSEGGLGFRQTDVAFLSTSALSPSVTSDVMLGLRRVRTGFTTVADPADGPEGETTGPVSETLALAAVSLAGTAPVRSRLVGQAVRASWGYNVLFDPAGSRLTFGVMAEAGDYTLVRTRETVPEGAGAIDPDAGDGPPNRIRSGVGWMRAGVEFSRPQYQLAPYVSLPVVTLASVRGEELRHGPRLDKLRVGLRLTLR